MAILPEDEGEFEMIEFILEYLANNEGLLSEWVCDSLCEIPEENDICMEVCKYSCRQKECYLRFFQRKMKESLK